MNLWQLLSKEFVLLIIISCTVAIPISFLLMGNWLESSMYTAHNCLHGFLLSLLRALC